VQLSELTRHFDEFWPENSAEDWDRVGLLVGSSRASIDKVLVSVDLTDSVIDEALENNCQLIVTHHPAILRGLNSVVEDELKGGLVSRLIKSGIANFAAHTNADVQSDGATSELARLLGLTGLEPILGVQTGFGHGVIGTLAKPISLREFASAVDQQLPSVARRIAFAGDPTKVITRVALCSGAGDSFLGKVLETDADVYVTSDLRHHPALDATQTSRENGRLALIDVSHWASESLWVRGAVERISIISGIQGVASKVVTDPWTEEVF
jgi:dinuclear metal center YbgI/SA1388 family protein